MTDHDPTAANDPTAADGPTDDGSHRDATTAGGSGETAGVGESDGATTAGEPVTDGGTPDDSADGATTDDAPEAGGVTTDARGDDGVADTLAAAVGGPLGRVPGNAAGLGVAVVAATVGFLALPVGVALPGISFVLLDQAILFVLYAMVLLGLNLQFGDTGLINFGPVLFLGLGLYGIALVSADVPSYASASALGEFWGLGLLAGVVLAVLGGLVLGVSSLRLREDYLGVTTLAAAEILYEVVRAFRTPFGGSKGITGIPQLVTETGGEGVLPLAENASTREVATLLLLVGILLVVYEGFRRLSGSPYGRVLRSIQADEDATRGMGKSTFRYKIQAFVYGAVVAGIAGGLLGMYYGSGAPGQITIDVTVILWIGMMIGGAGNHRGAIAGLGIVMLFELVIRLFSGTAQSIGISAVRFNALRGLLIGTLLIAVIRYRPAGLFGDPEKLEVFK